MVNTFLPFASIEASVRCLDNKRLGKQRVEAYQAATCARCSESIKASTRTHRGMLGQRVLREGGR